MSEVNFATILKDTENLLYSDEGCWQKLIKLTNCTIQLKEELNAGIYTVDLNAIRKTSIDGDGTEHTFNINKTLLLDTIKDMKAKFGGRTTN